MREGIEWAMVDFGMDLQVGFKTTLPIDVLWIAIGFVSEFEN